MHLSSLEKALEVKIRELFYDSVPRYYDHTMQVVANMKNILKRDGISGDRCAILTVAAYLHDIGYSAPYEGDYVGNIDDQSVKVPVHCDTGVKISQEVLSDLDVEEEIGTCVIRLVSIHHGVPEPDEDLKLLLEADQV